MIDEEEGTYTAFNVHAEAYVGSWEVKSGLWMSRIQNYYCYNFDFST